MLYNIPYLLSSTRDKPKTLCTYTLPLSNSPIPNFWVSSSPQIRFHVWPPVSAGTTAMHNHTKFMLW